MNREDNIFVILDSVVYVGGVVVIALICDPKEYLIIVCSVLLRVILHYCIMDFVKGYYFWNKKSKDLLPDQKDDE